ncbi:hypothetical protein C6N75_10200 [Streptomyces solincola]|uniref:WD40 repeat domain-containing protein n=1 Tax=Streptomyces solincola TaxID=2100817 RepID=A0A2S9PY07_9ACTN|nr:hypothetical protein C6N75_10200 [Streptomyces solincola]
MDLDDVAMVCAGDPRVISRLYEQSAGSHGGLRRAWTRGGPSLIRTQRSADRALVLHAALGDDADPRLGQELASLAGATPWRLVWHRVSGDITPPWPGPARGLAAGLDSPTASLLVADHQGTIRIISSETGSPIGRITPRVPPPRALTAWSDGSVLTLGSEGGLAHVRESAAPANQSGLSALLDDGPTRFDRILESVTAHLRHTPATALCASGSLLATADASGHVHAFFWEEGAGGSRSMRLHEGSVTALAAVELAQSKGGAAVPLLYSGGSDGCVRAWRVDAEPLGSPVLSRPCPPVTLAVGDSREGLVLAVGWADGLVEHHSLDSGEVRAFRPGPPVTAITLAPWGDLVVGTDESLVCLRPS